ncbi:hypothetical protein [Agrococcus sp. SGAir0287]|uniref:hypothetical protein n=1 Tax=Agrococcus sp. SGAir0287 TaxID=2070347 RepID=UPI0010CD27B3|nr:hypothetical protein [Agrococcus sp. SGAir0287]QCR20100.1 hypothetical protein C1N71_12155 [Agrococcus sp. SGAir0287]
MTYYGFMERSPGERIIRELEGNPTKIMERGTEIRELGEAMIDSATVLQSLADGTHGLKGKAVDKLVEGVGSAHGTLKEAGELYKPTGPIVWRYGYALSQVQDSLNGHVANCETLWQDYEALPGDRAGRGVGGFLQPEAGSEEAKTQEAQDEAKQEAYDAWKAEAELFDDDYDTWETAFETAAKDVGTALAGKIKDSFWDDLDGFVAGALEVLKWVGLVLAVAALLIGGPIIGLISGIVGLVVLGLTIYQKIRGDCGWMELGLAIFGAIPFGSLSKVFSKPGQAFFGGVFSKKGWMDAAFEFKGIVRAGSGGGLQGIRGAWSQFVAQGEAGRTVNTISRFFSGKGAIPLGSAHPVDIVAGTWMTTLGRLNMALGFGTGEGLYQRVVSGGGSS